MDDLSVLVKLHVDSFRGFFITRLGPLFVEELYRGFVQRPDAICQVSCNDSVVTGLVAGPVHPETFFRELLRERGLVFAKAAIPGLIRDPWNVGRRLLAAPLYRGDTPRVKGAALVSTICVTPAARGGGVATALLDAFCMTAAARGARYVYLTTDRNANEQVNAFYLRAGFALESELQRPGGRVMNRYLKDLGQT